MELVPGRECGVCGVCCKLPSIDEIVLQKPAGVTCTHLVKGGGCGIYDSRPVTCRNYHCGWRLMEDLGEDWRPDKSGVYITFVGNEVPQEDRARGALKVIITSAQAVLWPPFVEFVCRMVGEGGPVYLSISGPLGRNSAQTRINSSLAGLDLEKDRLQIIGVLAGLLSGVTAFAFNDQVTK